MHSFGKLACLASLVLSAQDISGTWKIWANGAGEDRAMQIQFRQSGNQLEGTIAGTNQPITGTANGRAIDFTRSGGGLRTPQKYKGYLFQAGTPVTMAGTFSHEGVWEYGWYGIQLSATAPSGPVVPTISGTWNDAGKPSSITQDAANNLIFTNGNGLRSAGRFADASTVIATQWEGGLRGKLTNNNATIQWANGTTWTRPAPSTFPWIGGGWSDANQSATVEQDFNDRAKLVFVNRMGWRSKGTFLNPTTVVASEWEGGLRGALTDNGETIRWANGTVWYRKVR